MNIYKNIYILSTAFKVKSGLSIMILVADGSIGLLVSGSGVQARAMPGHQATFPYHPSQLPRVIKGVS